jgi:hypothetical protein
MKIGKQQFRLIKEEEKIRQVTNRGLDYLPMDEILDLYQRESGRSQQKNSIENVTDESNKSYRCGWLHQIYYFCPEHFLICLWFKQAPTGILN